MDNEVIRSLQEEIGEQLFTEENTSEREDLDYKKELLRLALKHADVTLLNDVVEDLREVNEVKWRNLSADELYPNILTNAAEICKKFTVIEILQIGKTLEQKTRRKFCKSNATKAVNANSIPQAFIGDAFLEIQNKRGRRQMNIPSLQKLAKEVLMSDEYKLVQLQISLANALHREKREAWFKKSPIYMWAYIPHIWREHTVMKYFSCTPNICPKGNKSNSGH